MPGDLIAAPSPGPPALAAPLFSILEPRQSLWLPGDGRPPTRQRPVLESRLVLVRRGSGAREASARIACAQGSLSLLAA